MSLLMDPTGQGSAERVTLAPRPGSLTGKRLGLLDNTKPNAGLLLEEIGRLLVERAGMTLVARRPKPVFSLPGPVALLEAMAGECDAVVGAIGD